MKLAEWKVDGEMLRANTMRRRHTAPKTLADIGRDIQVEYISKTLPSLELDAESCIWMGYHRETPSVF